MTMMKPDIGSDGDLVCAFEVRDGWNIVIDGRFSASFPMESTSQVRFLVESTNKAHRQRVEEKQ